MRQYMKKLAVKLGRDHAYRMFLRDPKSVRLPLPVSVFCYRITDTTFGFLSSKDRADATLEMRKFAESKKMQLSVTYYRDADGPIASQIILWSKSEDNPVKEMTLAEMKANLEKPKEIGWSVRHDGRLIRGDRWKMRSVKTGKVIA